MYLTGPLSQVRNLRLDEVNSCTVHISWDPPSNYIREVNQTLNYTVTIGCQLSMTTNETEIIYSLVIIGRDILVNVTPVNDLGSGNRTSALFMAPSSSE